MNATLFRQAHVVNEGAVKVQDVLISGDRIVAVGVDLAQRTSDPEIQALASQAKVHDCTGKWLMPGYIDDQVHFREPGLTHKAEIATESAAAAGGITSFMEMPNTVPQALTQQLLEDKYDRAAEVSPVNYSFFMGASNHNLDEVLKTDPTRVCGIKVFMGSSTGDMLVDESKVLEGIFKEAPTLVATHCEDEATVRANSAAAKARHGEHVPIDQHPLIRSAEACYRSSSKAVELATKLNTQLHILHISTARELDLFDGTKELQDKRITAEACIHHLWFSDADYADKGTHIKWNPRGQNGPRPRTDSRGHLGRAHRRGGHRPRAPHQGREEQQLLQGPFRRTARPARPRGHARPGARRVAPRRKGRGPDGPSGGAPLPHGRPGFIRPGMKADLVVVQPNDPWTVHEDNVMSKCGWSPFQGHTFKSRVHETWVNGTQVWDGQRITTTHGHHVGERLTFAR